MSEGVIVTLRVPETLVKRVDDLIPLVSDEDELQVVGKISRSVVMRLALLRGLAQLEAQTGVDPQPRSKGTTKRKR